ncbi:MAG: hypothetical protein ACRD4B_09035, partial [Acidobacteriota bacterium]
MHTFFLPDGFILVLQEINGKQEEPDQKQTGNLLLLCICHNSGRRSFSVSITRVSCSGPSVFLTARV